MFDQNLFLKLFPSSFSYTWKITSHVVHVGFFNDILLYPLLQWEYWFLIPDYASGCL